MASPARRWSPSPAPRGRGQGALSQAARALVPCSPAGSGWRAWMEQGCTSTTRAGGQGQRTRMPKPERAARLGRAGAVATLGRRRGGGEAGATIPVSPVPAVIALLPTPPRMRRVTRWRVVRVLRRGWALLLVAWLDQAPRPLRRLLPAPWPAVTALEEPCIFKG